MSYTPTIGLEVHAELATKSKMFCGCRNEPHASVPNTHICPVCLAHPGTLPVPNESAIAMILQFGEAVTATRATYSEFDRKHYFYPDIPKAYQISQYAFPFLTGGSLVGVALTRVHLEEDTARSQHDQGDYSLIDFNRAGVPLMELVTEPVIHDAETAGTFARELQLLLRTLGISHANMEKGEMRVEANISVSATSELGTKVEVKNLNSFRSVEAAITFEVERQIALLESGQPVTQETRGWDEQKLRTFTQRSKETAKDYRYFPDPDIPKMELATYTSFDQQHIVDNLPLLPTRKREKYSLLGIPSQQIEIIIAHSVLDEVLATTLITTDKPDKLAPLAANYLTSDLVSVLQTRPEVQATIIAPYFAELMEMVLANEINSRVAKDVLGLLLDLEQSPRAYVEKHGLLRQTDLSTLLPLVETIVSEHTTAVAEFRAGKTASLQFLVGQGMKATKGSADPTTLAELLEKTITSETL